MQVDPRQPIMFDSDTMPGLGAGYWQMSQFMDDDAHNVAPIANDRTSKIARFCFAVLIGGGLIVGAIGRFLL
jgi:hypothetical protein